MKILSSNIISTTGKKIRAAMVVEVMLDGLNKPIQHKCVVETSVSPTAPQRRINRRLAAQAISDVTAFFDGEDAENPNIFHDQEQRLGNGELSASDEMELERELLAIKQHVSWAA